MKILKIVSAVFEKARELAAPTPEGGPEYDENGETIYPPGHRVLFDADRPERTRRTPKKETE